jgi:hypothetical protein
MLDARWDWISSTIRRKRALISAGKASISSATRPSNNSTTHFIEPQLIAKMQ